MTASGYITDVAYIPGFYPQMSPMAMRHVAALNGILPPKTADGFRYLELGCGLGRSLTTLAAANPQGSFVGVDVNPEHTAAVDRDIAAGGLGNARVVTSDFQKLPEDLGEFEFIALHGVFSWVAPEVREQILDVARRNLAPGGLLLVSYNAMPGWAHLQPIRGILRQYAALRQGDSVKRVREALAYLVFIRDRHAKYFDDNPRAAAYVDAILQQDIRYVVHEYLNEHWTSFYFADVAEMFRRVGLSFVGSLPVHTNFWDLCVRPEFQELFRTTSDRLVTEAHKDFCANTAFRWDIHAKSPQPMRGIDDRLREADDLEFRVAKPGTTLPYEANLGVVTSTVQGPLYETLLAVLADGSRRISQIVADPRLEGTPPADLARAVDAGVALGLFEVSARAVAGPHDTHGSAAEIAGGRPCDITHRFNQAVIGADALGGRPVAVASEATGSGVMLGDLDAAILHEFVERGGEGLADRLAERLTAAGRTLQRDGKRIEDPLEQRTLVQTACDAFCQTTLPHLVRIGVVSPR
jgi:SAM-dependent methyltransferase